MALILVSIYVGSTFAVHHKQVACFLVEENDVWNHILSPT